MEKKLHSFLPLDPQSQSLPEPHHIIQQSLMEEEYNAELTLLQGQQLMPRPEAVQQLLQMIAQQDVAAQH